MAAIQSTQQFEQGLSGAMGVLVVNLGTPSAPTTRGVRRFLRQFLFDPRVVEYPRLPWWLVLNLVILRIRPRRSAAAYRKIWTDKGSPLLVYSRQIATRLQDRLSARAEDQVRVELAMTYGDPSIGDAIDSLLDNGVQRILIIPLYPQYSGTTTASVFDAVARKISTLRRIPETRFVNDYHDAPGYIDALAQSVRDNWAEHGRGEKLLMSFHGIPKKNSLNGDPYPEQCQKTGQLLAAALELGDDEWTLAFQSRVGRAEWLSPFTDETITEFGRQGLSLLDVVCPGFCADCLETLEEIELQNAEKFTAAGGGSLNYVPALNARDDHVSFLASLVEHHISHWADAIGADAVDNDNVANRQSCGPSTAIGAAP